jgi:hypothetical protein
MTDANQVVLPGQSAVATGRSIYLLVWLSPIIIAMLHDFLTQWLIHPAYVIGVLVLVPTSFRDGFVTTDAWLTFTQWLANVST